MAARFRARYTRLPADTAQEQSRRPRVVVIIVMLVMLALVLLTVCSLALALPPYKRSLAPLQFTKNGTFQISIFQDLHFGENAWDQWGPQQDINSLVVMNSVLDKESQQLVVLNGDLITGENTYEFNSTNYIDEIVGPLVKRNLSWASTYGNHDSAYNLSRDAILAREQTYPNARTQSMVPGLLAGVSNYYLPVLPSNGSSTPSLILWFFDSRGGNYYQMRTSTGGLVGQPDWVDTSVVDWFRDTNAALAGQYARTIPSVAFVHIPTNASQALQSEAGVQANYEPGINDDYILAQQAQGWCANGTDDGTCEYGGQDVPFMQALVDTPGLMAVFSGHDHGDTWCYKWDTQLEGVPVKGNGINLCFSQHSGYGGYGNWIRGSRQLFFTEDQLAENSLDTWIRLESGDVVASVVLNSTYNHDYYPAVPDTKTYCPTCNYTIITPMPGT